MKMTHTSAIWISGAALLLATACQKDTLTIESTAPPSTHICSTIHLSLNVDSVLHLPPPHTTHVSMCACDSLSIVPTNIPSDLAFVHWYLDQSGHTSYSDQAHLDTITVASEILLVLLQTPDSFYVQVPVSVQVGPC